MTKQARCYVIGDIIGVGFRAWTKIQAKKNQVSGWVRNVFDKPEVFGHTGGVEVLLQANEQQLVHMIEDLKKGSEISRVEHVDVMLEPITKTLEGFEIRK